MEAHDLETDFPGALLIPVEPGQPTRAYLRELAKAPFGTDIAFVIPKGTAESFNNRIRTQLSKARQVVINRGRKVKRFKVRTIALLGHKTEPNLEVLVLRKVTNTAEDILSGIDLSDINKTQPVE